MLPIEPIYWLLGGLLLVAAALNLREGRRANAAFWAILACPFLFGRAIIGLAEAGQRLPAQAMGVGVIALGILATRGGPRRIHDDAETLARRRADAARIGRRLFAPVLVIPLGTLALVLSGPYLRWNGQPLLDPSHLTLISLGLACVLALAFGLRTTGGTFGESLCDGRRLLDAMGWAALLPMLLATLGSVFAATGVGDAIAAVTGTLIPIESRTACLLAFALGMVVFTVIMGNAFAAFPVMMAGIGLPLLVLRHDADPALLGAVGMLTGYCGTLLTPMAANFNMVPAALLDLNDPYGVIRAQVPTALVLLAFNVALMALLVFR